jgi:hypothetical protein
MQARYEAEIARDKLAVELGMTNVSPDRVWGPA